MSLAAKLLTSSPVVESVVEYSEVDTMANGIKAIATESWMDTALEALVGDIYTVDKAYHTADIIAEVKVIREGADPAVLLEGMVRSGIEKIKNAFKNFWAKLKAWFAAVKRQFKLIFTKGKDFIKEFKVELNKKAVKGFTYVGREYDLDAGDDMGEKVFDEIAGAIVGILNLADGSKLAESSKEDFVAMLAKEAGISDKEANKTAGDIQDDFIKGLKVGASDIGELSEKIKEKYHKGNDDDYTTTVDDFANMGKDDMMDFVDGFDKAMKEMEKFEKKFDTTMTKVIKTFDSIEKKDFESNGDEAYKRAQYVSRYLTALLAVGKVPCNVQQAIYKECNSQCERVLKQFLRWKPAKEAAEVEEEGEKDAGLLEQAMAMLGF